MDSWAPITLICGCIFAVAKFISMLINSSLFAASFTSLFTGIGGFFLLGCAIGFIVWVLFLRKDESKNEQSSSIADRYSGNW